jgi:hypothetical protein
MDLNVITPEDAERRRHADQARAVEEAGAPAEAAAAGERVGGAEPVTPDDAFSKLLKYIPAISVGTYLAIDGVLAEINNSGAREALLWIVFVVLLGITYLYRVRRGVKRAAQIAATLGAFVIWVFAIGGPFAASWDGYESYYGSIALFLAAAALVAWNPPPMPADS